MIARLMLRNDRSTIYLFLWMEGEVVVNLENWSYPWPSLFGFWNGKKFWGDIDYNEETKELIAECSDNDTLTTSIKENMRITLGSKMLIKSKTDGSLMFTVVEHEAL